MALIDFALRCQTMQLADFTVN